MTEVKNLAQYVASHSSKPLEVDGDELDFLIHCVYASPEYDDSDAVVACVIADAEALSYRAEDAQNREDDEWEEAVNDPTHPRHEEVWAELNATKPFDPLKAAMDGWASQQDPAELAEMAKKMDKMLKKIDPTK